MSTPTTTINGSNLPANPANQLHALLTKAKSQIAMALPKHLTPERMIRVAVTAFHRTPALQECSPLSILGCVIQAAELGLELTGALGQAYMVPYWNKNTRQREAQFQVGYRGLVSLAFNSGRVSYFNAHVVREGDFFEYEYGTAQELRHRPAMQGRGDVVAVYAVFRLTDGASDFEVMSFEDVEAHRKQYSKQSGEFSPWNTAWEEMAKKTVIRRLAKRAPISIEIQKAAVLDELAEAGVPQNLTIDIPTASVPAPPTGHNRLPTSTPPAVSVPENNDAGSEDEHSSGSVQHVPEEPPTSVSDMDRDDIMHGLIEQITHAKDAPAMSEIGAAMMRDQPTIGEERYTKVMEAYRVKHAEVEKARKAKK